MVTKKNINKVAKTVFSKPRLSEPLNKLTTIVLHLKSG